MGLVALGIDGAVPWAIAGLILFRETGIGLLMVVATAFGMERFHFDVCRSGPHSCA